ncbi:hypothetical protein GBK02_09965 [Dechloromonas sp. TW-R-39-2]|uniref:hypothetical protein n=1 Tax=Dechloromonas sp. TW-R-39-2 TaxID=2654218 RepID=UPI00193D2DC9|nr:hypothetical protein [Dechloromonas sp. TW-R-39-2]QRM19703.1 hypothetical protein GBK02_09965 [Dechloromonas sp. TW-R-39-2]
MDNVIVRAKVDEGLSLLSKDGRPLTLAVLDASGRILASGPTVNAAVFASSVDAYDNFWQGNGHLTAVEII